MLKCLEKRGLLDVSSAHSAFPEAVTHPVTETRRAGGGRLKSCKCVDNCLLDIDVH